MFFENPIKGPDPSWEKTDETLHRGGDSGSENRIEFTPMPVAETEMYRVQAMRLAADLDNMRKRQRKDAERLVNAERRNVLGDLLDVLDSFDRALAIQGAESNQWLEGFEATRVQLLEVMKRYGAAPLEALGQPFDPAMHEAIATALLPEFSEGTVVEVIQSGYAMQDGTVLRPAKVVVVRH